MSSSPVLGMQTTTVLMNERPMVSAASAESAAPAVSVRLPPSLLVRRTELLEPRNATESNEERSPLDLKVKTDAGEISASNAALRSQILHKLRNGGLQQQEYKNEQQQPVKTEFESVRLGGNGVKIGSPLSFGMDRLLGGGGKKAKKEEKEDEENDDNKGEICL